MSHSEGKGRESRRQSARDDGPGPEGERTGKQGKVGKLPWLRRALSAEKSGEKAKTSLQAVDFQRLPGGGKQRVVMFSVFSFVLSGARRIAARGKSRLPGLRFPFLLLMHPQADAGLRMKLIHVNREKRGRANGADAQESASAGA